MNKKNFVLIGLVLVMLGSYIVFFTDWFKPQLMQISHTSRPMGGARGSATPLTFGLGDEYELTEVKVVSLADWQANKNVEPLWHLVSDDGSDSINHFFYGEKIGGMDPVVEGAKPQKLQPGVVYRLFITAGKIKGQHDFQIGGAAANVSTNK